jgi:DNA-binding transcriptional LysR family regulator
MPLDVDRLRVFRTVATLGSFTAAARSLAYTQPGVSHHVKQLERELGVVLIERSSRGIRLTPPGRTLLEHADALLTRLADAERDVIEIAQQGGAELRMVAAPTIAATVLPPAVASFRRELPNVALSLSEADPPGSLQQLAGGGWDLALAYDYPILQREQDGSLAWEPLFLDHMAVCLPAGHPSAGRGSVSLEELEAETWVAPYDSVCREAIESACACAGFTPRVVSETNDYMAMQGLVATGVGVAVVPRLVACIALRDGVVMRRLNGRPLERVVAIVSRRDGYTSNTSRTMRDFLRSAAARLATGPLPLALPELAAA